MDGLKVHYLTWRFLEMSRDGEQQDSALELGTCVLASTRRCNFLVLVLALFQTTYVLRVNNVYNSSMV